MTDLQNGWAIHDADDGSAHVLKTDDGGHTWRDVSPPASLYADDLSTGPFAFRISAEFLDADRAWVSFAFKLRPPIGSVWRTVDGGQHWEEALLGRRNFGLDWILFDFVDPQYGWAVIDVFHGAGSHTGEAFRTEDGGLTWERLLEGFGNASGIDFVDRRVGWISTDVFEGVTPPWALLITQDGGSTWKMTTPDPYETLDPFADPEYCDFQVLQAFSALSGVLYRPNCWGQDAQGNLVNMSWLQLTTDAMRTHLSVRMPPGPPDFIDASTGWVIGPTDPNALPPPASWSLYKTRDGGRTWQLLQPMDWQGTLDFIDERNGWRVDEDGVLRRTSDGGLTWEVLHPRSLSSVAPQDATIVLELTADLEPISLGNASRLEMLTALPADDPTSLAVFRDTLFVGNAHGQLLQWSLGPMVHRDPAIWRVHDDWVYDLAARDDGGDLFSASRDGSIRVWELFSLDGFWFDLPFHTGEVLSVALSPDLSMLASGGEDGRVKVEDLSHLTASEPRLDLEGHTGWIWDLAFSGDGKTLASASGDTKVKLWSADNGELLATLGGFTSTVSRVVFAPRGGHLAAASWDGSVRIFDATTQETVHVLQGHSDWVLGLAYAPLGDVLVSSGADGKILIWNATSGELITPLADLDAPVRAVAIDEQGRYLIAVADDDRVTLWGVTP